MYLWDLVSSGFPVAGASVHTIPRSETDCCRQHVHSPAHAVFIINNRELQPIQAMLF